MHGDSGSATTGRRLDSAVRGRLLGSSHQSCPPDGRGGRAGREVNHRFGQKRKKPDEPDKEIADELGDIFWALICLANSLQIDLDAALERTLRKVTERDHDRFKRKES